MRICIALFIGLFFFRIGGVSADDLPGTPDTGVQVVPNTSEVTARTEDCSVLSNPALCEVWKKGSGHESGPAVPNMVCWRILQSKPQAVVFRIGKLPQGKTVPEGGAAARVLFATSVSEDVVNLLPTPQAYREKLPRAEDSRICIGAWRLRRADFIYFCNEDRTAVLWRNDIDEKLALAGKETGAASYEPILLKKQ